jgi:DNA-binding transcriptional MerR regulator
MGGVPVAANARQIKGPAQAWPPIDGVPTHAIGEAAQALGVSQRTLRFYEARGFIKPQRAGEERRYSQDDCDRVVLILQAKRLGFTLREIADLLAESESGRLALSRAQCTEQINLLERQKRAIETALDELRRVYSTHYLRALNHASGG